MHFMVRSPILGQAYAGSIAWLAPIVRILGFVLRSFAERASPGLTAPVRTPRRSTCHGNRREAATFDTATLGLPVRVSIQSSLALHFNLCRLWIAGGVSQRPRSLPPVIAARQGTLLSSPVSGPGSWNDQESPAPACPPQAVPPTRRRGLQFEILAAKASDLPFHFPCLARAAPRQRFSGIGPAPITDR